MKTKIIKDNNVFQLIEIFSTCTTPLMTYKRSLGFVVKDHDTTMRDNWKYKNFELALARFEVLSSPIR